MASQIRLGAHDDGTASRLGLTRSVLPRGLIVLVGPPAAGKTSFAAELVSTNEVSDDCVVSSDAISRELFGPGDNSDRDGEIFAERDRRLRELLAEGKAAIADSTNVRPEARERLLALAREAGATAVALRFPAAPETVHHQHNRRNEPVAGIDDYIELMEKTASTHQLEEEGFQLVLDVPGADQDTTVAQAARLFRIA